MTPPVLAYIHLASYVVPATVGVARLSHLGKAVRILTVLCILACVNIAAQFYLASLRLTNYFVSDFYSVVEVSLLCAVFCFSTASRGTRRVLTAMVLLYVAFWVVDMVWFYNPAQINSVMAIVSRFFLVVMSLVTLQTAMRDEASHITGRPVFWVVIGVLLYASGTMVVFAVSNELLNLDPPYFDIAWHVNWSLLIIANLAYTRGMLCKSQT